MNPLEIDKLKADGSVKLAYNRVAKQICVVKERNPQTAGLYKILREIKSRYIPKIYRLAEFERRQSNRRYFRRIL